jgi:hypothetical protein
MGALVVAIRMGQLEMVRSQFNRAAAPTNLGNIQATEKGPGAYGRRVVRRKVYRRTNGVTGRFLRKLLG